MAKIETLYDPFDGSSLDTGLWTVDDGSPTVTSGYVQLVGPCHFKSAVFDFSDSNLIIRLQPADGEMSWSNISLLFGSEWMYFGTNNSGSGSGSSLYSDFWVNDANIFWLRYRVGTAPTCTVYVDTSPDGVTWTQQAGPCTPSASLGATQLTVYADSGFTNRCSQIGVLTLVDKSGSDDAGGTDAGTLAAALAGADTGAGTDVLVTVGLSGTEGGAGTDAQTALSATLAASETGAATDAPVTIGQAASDLAGGTDSSTLAATLGGADTGSGADAESLTVLIIGSDLGATAELVAALDAVLASDDITSLAEAGQIDVILIDAELVGVLEAAGIVSAISDSETAAGADVQSIVATLTDSDDSAQGEHLTSRETTGYDDGSYAEDETSGASLSTSDTGGATDSFVDIGLTGSDDVAIGEELDSREQSAEETAGIAEITALAVTLTGFDVLRLVDTATARVKRAWLRLDVRDASDSGESTASAVASVIEAAAYVNQGTEG